MPRKNLLDRLKEEQEKLSNKKITNDLLTSKKDQFHEASNSFEALKKHGFSLKTVKIISKNNLSLRSGLHLTDIEYLLFVAAVGNSTISISFLSSVTRESSLTVMVQLQQHMFSLYHRGILSVFPGDEGIAFRLTTSAINYLHSGGEFVPEDKNLKKVIFEMDSIANLYNISLPHLREMGEHNILLIIHRYADQYEFFNIFKKMYEETKQITEDYKFLFYMTGHLILNSLDYPSIDVNDNLVNHFVNSCPNHEKIINRIFREDNHTFFKNKIYDHSTDESGKADKNTIELHADFKRKYLKNIIKEKKHDDLILFDKIPKKELFFNPKNKEEIEELADMLSVKYFNNIKKRLLKQGIRTGFIILFSGFPGTGKTELSMQLAKKTGRNIIKVDMSQIRSKWWGEDEKNIKNIFNNYSSILADSKVEPILLLNEADAIIGKRLDVTGNNGAIISSINATQNIILDAFDEFEGILIATTNLTKNFDEAFERRFLYKIEFEKPNLNVRTQILTSMLKISEEDAKIIASQYELSGANIENIYRKLTTKKILYGEEPSIEQILNLAKEEKIEKSIKIGF